MKSGVVLFLWAAERAKPDVLKAFIDHGVDVDVFDPDDPERSRALHLTAALGLAASMQLLLSAKADPDAKDEFGRTPLLLACSASSAINNKNPVQAMACARLLISAGANVNAVSKNDMTALYGAAYAGWGNLFALILQNEAEIDPSVIGERAAWKLIHAISNSSKQNELEAMVGSVQASRAIEEMMGVAKEEPAPNFSGPGST